MKKHRITKTVRLQGSRIVPTGHHAPAIPSEEGAAPETGTSTPCDVTPQEPDEPVLLSPTPDDTPDDDAPMVDETPLKDGAPLVDGAPSPVNTATQEPNTQDSPLQTQDSTLKTPDSRLKTLDSPLQTPTPERSRPSLEEIAAINAAARRQLDTGGMWQPSQAAAPPEPADIGETMRANFLTRRRPCAWD